MSVFSSFNDHRGLWRSKPLWADRRDRECMLIEQARIALLEGQRRSAENLKVDLLRRVKMLEFALRQER